MIDTKLQDFANLLEIARRRAPDAAYEKQRELVARYRAEGRAFLASMPVRHRFRCPQCGVETAEVEMHFEDPAQPLSSAASAGMWGQPAGRHFSTKFSLLHSMLEHSIEIPAALSELLRGVRGVSS